LFTTAAAAVDAASLIDCDRAEIAQVLAPRTAAVPADARAVWLDRRLIRWPGSVATGQFVLSAASRATLSVRSGQTVTGADIRLPLSVHVDALTPAMTARYAYLGAGVHLSVSASDAANLDTLIDDQVVITREDTNGRVLDSTFLQWAGFLDDRFAAAADAPIPGAWVLDSDTAFRIWAPTAQAVSLCLYGGANAPATQLVDATRDPSTGFWSTSIEQDLHSRFFLWLIDVPVRGEGLVRNRVTDPYSIGLNADSKRSAVLDLARDDTKPQGWPVRTKVSGKRGRVHHAVDMVIYELHVRDFSATDTTVPAALRGKYLAFGETRSRGMMHLRALADAGLTDVHLLPVFDLATVPERGCVSPAIAGSGDSTVPQSIITPLRTSDCFNWGYDPFHFTAPEGSYSMDPDDPAARVREFRSMVHALNDIGLRVGMDVVYNHTSSAGQDARSVLDRIVPGYYQRLNAQGNVETSTCCQNTATEHRMMARLMIDSAVVWARDFHIDSFRFDLMAHQPRDVMEQLQSRVDAAAGGRVQLLGEGWNFGEVANGARFVQASQLSLNGSGIGTFSDRARDAVRGGSAMDNDTRLISAQGFVNGLHYDRNAQGQGSRADLMRAADMVRVGLAGSLRDFTMIDSLGRTRRLADIDYGGQPAGYVTEPAEVVNYVENHDNQTLFDINVFKLPVTTSRHDRARVQMLAAAINLFSQGTSYFHAGIDLLRSKSLDRNSYDSGDWFNRIDWSARDNHFGTGLPMQSDNGATWGLMRPLLANRDIEPGPKQIRFARDVFRDLLRVRLSSRLFRLQSADEIKSRLTFPNTGTAQIPTLLVGHLDGLGMSDERFRAIVYFVNVDRASVDFTWASAASQPWVLHPVQRASSAADERVRDHASFDRSAGRFSIPARSAAVFVLE